MTSFVSPALKLAEDRYEAILAKYNWRSSAAPRGYQPGVGRGAKPISTTGELRVATGLAPSEEDRIFDSLDAVEERRQRDARRRRAGFEAADLLLPPPSAAAGQQRSNEKEEPQRKSGRPMLSMDDLAMLDTIKPVKNTGLTLRSAREEGAELAEEYEMGDVDGITASEVHEAVHKERDRAIAGLLSMGSVEEQSTYITHARVHWGNDQRRRALNILREGCERTGHKGPGIWQELLLYLDRSSAEGGMQAKRAVLEKATTACPTEEQLWMQLLAVTPPHEKLSCTQRAVMHCPGSERMWNELLVLTPRVKDQKRLLLAALKPELPSLWGRLARLAGPVEGKKLLQDGFQRYRTADLALEAAKFVEWSLQHAAPQEGAGASTSSFPGPLGALEEHTRSAWCVLQKSVSVAMTRSRIELDPVERQQWLLKAAFTAEERVPSCRPTPDDMAAAAGDARYVWTAAFMFALFLCPDMGRPTAVKVLYDGLDRLVNPSVTSAGTWLSDLLGLLPAAQGLPAGYHMAMRNCSLSILSALLATWWVLVERHGACAVQLSDEAASHSPLRPSGEVFDLLVRVFGSAPNAGLTAVLEQLMQDLKREALPPLLFCTAGVKTEANNDEEELLPVATGGLAGGSLSAASLAVKREPLSEAAADQQGQDIFRVDDTEPLLLLQSVPTEAEFSWGARLKHESGEFPAVVKPEPFHHEEVESLTKDCSRPASRAFPPMASLLLLMLSRSSPSLAAGTAPHPDAVLCIAKTLFDRKSCAVALSCLQLGYAYHFLSPRAVRVPPPKWLEKARLCLLCAMAKTVAAMDQVPIAEAVLHAATRATIAERRHNAVASTGFQADAVVRELPWVKLCILQRSQKEDIRLLLNTALEHCPSSERLWLMRLEAEKAVAQQLLAVSSPATFSEEQSRRWAEEQEQQRESLRELCRHALSSEHCRDKIRVWTYIAVSIESDVLANAAAARALLVEASHHFRCSTRSLLSSSHHPRLRQRSSSSRIGVVEGRLEDSDMYRLLLSGASVDVERSHTGSSSAVWEVLAEQLQALPRSRSAADRGALLIPKPSAATTAEQLHLATMALHELDRLLMLYIDLAPPANRGKSAWTVLTQLKVEQPLVLLAAARLYFQGSRGAASPKPLQVKAVGQTLKALELSHGRCGDAIAQLWELLSAAGYEEVSREIWAAHCQALGISAQVSRTDPTAASDPNSTEQKEDSTPPLTAEEVRWLVFSLTAFYQGYPHYFPLQTSGAEEAERSADQAAMQPERMSSPSLFSLEGNTGWSLPQSPNYGPHWIYVSKVQDPSNATLLGFRDEVEMMLLRVRQRLQLTTQQHQSERQAPAVATVKEEPEE